MNYVNNKKKNLKDIPEVLAIVVRGYVVDMDLITFLLKEKKKKDVEIGWVSDFRITQCGKIDHLVGWRRPSPSFTFQEEVYIYLIIATQSLKALLMYDLSAQGFLCFKDFISPWKWNCFVLAISVKSWDITVRDILPSIWHAPRKALLCVDDPNEWCNFSTFAVINLNFREDTYTTQVQEYERKL